MDSNHDKIMYMLGELTADVKSIRQQDLPAIKEQTTKTNGRVTELERQVRTNTDFIINVKGRIAVIYGVINVGGIVAWEVVKTTFFSK